MLFNDFEYDGILLSSFGMVIGTIDGSSGTTIVPHGNEISFNTVPIQNGLKQKAISSTYNNVIEATFQICKNPCASSMEITTSEYLNLVRWLTRGSHKKLRFIGYNSAVSLLKFNAIFNVSRVELDGYIVGLELNVITDSPFGYTDDVTESYASNSSNWEFTLVNQSVAEGYLYPKLLIKTKSSGTLTLSNSFDNSTMTIRNCSVNEEIIIEYPYKVESTFGNHDLSKDFNWSFLTLSCLYNDVSNVITVSLPATVTVTYTPLVPTGL